MKRILTLLGIILAFSLSLSAQGGYQVKGTVVDATGPVIGATVMEAGTNVMTGETITIGPDTKVPPTTALIVEYSIK
jgi:hypothetical protein